MIPRHSAARIRSARFISSNAGSKGSSRPTGAVPHRKEDPVSAEEKTKILHRRIAKAERDERIDITLALTPVRT